MASHVERKVILIFINQNWLGNAQVLGSNCLAHTGCFKMFTQLLFAFWKVNFSELTPVLNDF